MNRLTTLIVAVFGFLFFGLEMISGFILYRYTDSIFGWSQTEYLILLSSAACMSFLYEFFFVVSHENLAADIIRGQLDFSLLRPVNSLLFYTLYRIDIPSGLNMILTVACQFYFMKDYPLTSSQVILDIGAILLGTYFIFLLNQLALMLSFWKENATSAMGFAEDLVAFGAKPMPIYPKPIVLVLTWGVPVLISQNLPVLIIKGEAYGRYLTYLVLANLLGTLLVHLVWQKGLNRYQSAN